MPSRYPKTPFERGSASGVYMPKRGSEKVIPLRHNPPGTIILVHGVNDLGSSYAAVEEGLCQGLAERLDGELRPAAYRQPGAADRNKLEPDPDATFFRRTVSSETLSPVVPFYWGFREEAKHVQRGDQTTHGQCLDRYGNRLDLDFAKGGGPFANATSTLPDMWNRGKSGLLGALDKAQRDATHPVLDNPGRLYMVLAARRLAALVCMIRDYDEDEVVSIVAHSQGCLVSLLAQAFLQSPQLRQLQPNARPADTLIMTHPPYSLVDDAPVTVRNADYYAGRDAAMDKRYLAITGNQTLNARLTTLANIVKGAWAARRSTPPLADMADPKRYFGAVGKQWQAAADRDNRGKTYLYFCPEDMTVALANVQGIGWQGVPEQIIGKRIKVQNFNAREVRTLAQDIRQPLQELGEGFKQRVFTRKLRPHPQTGSAVKVGLPAGYFDLRPEGEDDHGHTAVSQGMVAGYFARTHLTTSTPPDRPGNSIGKSMGRRLINGEALKQPVLASLLEGALTDSKGRPGAAERVGPDDAAIAITSDYGINEIWELIRDPRVFRDLSNCKGATSSPQPSLHAGTVAYVSDLEKEVAAHLNKGKSSNAERCRVIKAVVCLGGASGTHRSMVPPTLLIKRTETPDEARRRWQNTIAPRSFHGAIFGGSLNHRHVTAYDVAIGGGKAAADPKFYRYLCAVADWRLQNQPSKRPEILKWSRFAEIYGDLYSAEPAWRAKLIEDSAEYYSRGIMPSTLPLIPEGLPASIVCELESDITRMTTDEPQTWSS